jgi:hydrogenase nickel incorporation protein HypA/HybF
MHEVSIAAGMAEELARIARENRAKKINTVHLHIGKKSGIVIDSLRFAFDTIKLEHPLLSTTEIVIEEIPLFYLCRDCKAEFETNNIYFPPCPFCSSHRLQLLSGEEMNIKDLEIEV